MAVSQPPADTFFHRVYNDSWKTNWKGYIDNSGIPIADRYTTLRRYETLLPPMGLTPLQKKKKIQLENRRKDLLGEAYKNKLKAIVAAAAANPLDATLAAAAVNAAATLANQTPDLRAGCVIVFSDRKAIYTVSKENNNDKFGFPKGEIEYYLTDPLDIQSVERETSLAAALRELKEETGYYPSSIPNPTPVTQPFAATLHRLQFPEFYTIRSVKYQVSNQNYYLIFFLDELSTYAGPPRIPLTQNAMNENIIRYEFRDQYTVPTQHLFNHFSKISFQEYFPGGFHKISKKKTRKTKRRYRKTMRSRG